MLLCKDSPAGGKTRLLRIARILKDKLHIRHKHVNAPSDIVKSKGNNYFFRKPADIGQCWGD